MSKRAWFSFAVVGVIWGLPYFFIRIALRELDPGTLIFLRTTLAGLILLPVALYRRNWASLRGHLPALVAFTATEIAIPWLLLCNAEEKVTSSFSGLVIAIVPLIGAGIAVAIGSERLGRRRTAGLVVGLAGVVILVGVDITGTNLAAVFELLACALGYATAPAIAGRKLKDVPSFEIVTFAVVLTAVAYLPFGVTHLPAHLHAEIAWSVVALSCVCTIVGFMFFFLLIKEIGPSRAVVITYINPAVALLLGVLALNEPFTLGLAIGFPIILVGSVLGTWKPKPVSEGRAVPAGIPNVALAEAHSASRSSGEKSSFS